MKRVTFEPDTEKARSSAKRDNMMEQFLSGNIPDPVEIDEEVVRKTGGSAPTTEELRERVIEALKNIYDPEIPVNIFDLGLIYRVDIKENGFAEVDMTLTAPGCPVAQTFPGMVEGSVKLVPGISDAVVELVWDPPWRQDMISEAARLELGLI